MIKLNTTLTFTRQFEHRSLTQQRIYALQALLTVWDYNEEEKFVVILCLQRSMEYHTSAPPKPTRSDIVQPYLTRRERIFGGHSWIPQILLVSSAQQRKRRWAFNLAVIQWGMRLRLHVHKTKLFLELAKNLVLWQRDLFTVVVQSAVSHRCGGRGWSVVEDLYVAFLGHLSVFG